MGALPRPEVPPGPHRDLVDELHSLHHRAGWPSLRTLALEAGCSHTTVSSVFSSRRLPSWGILQLVVEALGGDEAQFHSLWLAASAPGPGPVAPVSLLAGRSSELTAVRRHLGQDSGGLLLVRGVAGIGKTRLVQAAVTAATHSVSVGWGTCLPLATEVPLLPLVDVLRSVHEVDAGQWLKEALAERPPYVARWLSRLLPELSPATEAPADPDDRWSGHRMFAAVEAVLSALGSIRPLAVVLEDLHWADGATLDLVEHLLARRVAVPLVATWRSEETSVPDATADWCARVRRLDSVRTLSLGPLTREETAEQIAMLPLRRPGPRPSVDSIFERSEGLPLFTEQLVAESEPELPELLGELLDRRLTPLDEPAWQVVRALGLAGRPMPEQLLSEVTRLPPAELTTQLHDLEARHLLRLAPSLVGLRHALLAEAVLRRMTALEVADEHRRLASALAANAEPVPAEVAEHWQRAGEAQQELIWRIRAAQQARRRFAYGQSAVQWRRALALWPDDADAVGSPEVRRVDAYIAALKALQFTDPVAGHEVAKEALSALTDDTGRDAAETYRAAAPFLQEPDEAVRLAERAVAIYEQLPPCPGHVEALGTESYLLDGMGRTREATALAAAASEASARLGVQALHKSSLAVQASLERETQPDLARSRIETAASIELAEPDLGSEIYVASLHTDMLLTANAPPDDVAAAARSALRAAAGEEVETWPLSVVRANVAMAYRKAGKVGRAAELVDARTEEPVSLVRRAEHEERAVLDALRGRPETAERRLEELSAMPLDSGVYNLIESTVDVVAVDLWSGRPRAAYDKAVDLLRTCAPTEASGGVAELLGLAARAAADLADSGPPTGREELSGTVLGLLDAGVEDPFKYSPADVARPALAAVWTAETLRLTGGGTVDVWMTAAREWDRLRRPHDAGYCRWRAAEVALRSGQGTVARTLLRRARRDAREHVPLLEALAATAGGISAETGRDTSMSPTRPRNGSGLRPR